MSQQFGFGCGRVLLRAVSEFLGDEFGEQTPAAANMGGTRNGESLTLVANNVLRNFQRYAVGLHARLARRKAGHGAGSQSSLLVLGRRLLAPDFICFTLLFSDVMNRQRPFTLAVQEQGELAFARKQQEVLEDTDLLYEVRKLIAVIGLLQHYSPHEDLQHLMRAMRFSKMGRRFPQTVKHLFDILVLRQFQAVNLQLVVDLAADTLCVTPRCWCRSRRSKEHVYVSVPLTFGRRKRRVAVPEWVAYSSLTKETAKAQAPLHPIDVPLRYETFPKPPVRPALQGVPLFRKHVPACETSRYEPEVQRLLQRAAQAVEHFLKALHASYAAYWTDIGVPTHLQKLLPDMSCCWDLDTLIAGSQPQGQYDALERLRLHFKSQVDAGTRWPDFNYVEKSWPSQKETQRQYRVFRAILNEQKKHHCWEQVEQCHVACSSAF